MTNEDEHEAQIVDTMRRLGVGRLKAGFIVAIERGEIASDRVASVSATDTLSEAAVPIGGRAPKSPVAAEAPTR